LAKTGEKRLKPVLPSGRRTGPAMIGRALDWARSVATRDEPNRLKSVPIMRSLPLSGVTMETTASGAALIRDICGFCSKALEDSWSNCFCVISGLAATLLAMPRSAVMLVVISACRRVEIRLSSF
jgi:hypothetical protein